MLQNSINGSTLLLEPLIIGKIRCLPKEFAMVTNSNTFVGMVTWNNATRNVEREYVPLRSIRVGLPYCFYANTLQDHAQTNSFRKKKGRVLANNTFDVGTESQKENKQDGDNGGFSSIKDDKRKF